MELYMFCYTPVQGFWIFKGKRYFLLDIFLVGFPSQRNESQLHSLRHVSKIQTVNRVIRCSPWRLASCGVQPVRTGVGGAEWRSGGGFQANCRQKATSFIIERDVKAAVWGLHSQQAKQDESRKDHIMFQMTEQRFIYQRRFSPSTERESNKREAGLAESVRWPMTNGRLLATLWLDALMSTFCAEFGLLLTVTFALYWPKWHVIFHILPIIARLLMSTPLLPPLMFPHPSVLDERLLCRALAGRAAVRLSYEPGCMLSLFSVNKWPERFSPFGLIHASGGLVEVLC